MRSHPRIFPVFPSMSVSSASMNSVDFGLLKVYENTLELYDINGCFETMTQEVV